MIRSDWHIHSEYSYDAALPLETIAQEAIRQGLTRVGITDHLNFNDHNFMTNLRDSAAGFVQGDITELPDTAFWA